MKVLRATLLFLLSLSFASPIARADFETPIALINAKIVRPSGEVIDSGTIVIEGKRIVAVGAEVNVPPAPERPGVRGRYA